MSAGPCCRKFFFLFVSIVTLGAVLALFVTAIVLGQHVRYFDIDKKLLPIAITAAAAACLIFLFAIIVSCSQKRGCRIALAIIFLVFAVILGVGSVVALLRQGDVVPAIAKAWSGTSQADTDLRVALEDTFDCCGWDALNSSCGDKKQRVCEPLIRSDVEKYWKAVAGALLGFAGLLLILGGIAVNCACNEPRVGEFAGVRYTDPIHPGILAVDSRGPYKYTW
jgi:hypothetical protein